MFCYLLVHSGPSTLLVWAVLFVRWFVDLFGSNIAMLLVGRYENLPHDAVADCFGFLLTAFSELGVTTYLQSAVQFYV